MPSTIGIVASHINYKPPTPLIALLQPTSADRRVYNDPEADGPDYFDLTGGSIQPNTETGWDGYYSFSTGGRTGLGQFKSNNSNHTALSKQISPYDDYTVEAYLKIDGPQWSTSNTQGRAYIIGTEDSYRTNSWGLYLYTSNSIDNGPVRKFGIITKIGSATAKTVTYPINFEIGTYYHFAVTRKENVLRIYIDGVLYSQSTAPWSSAEEYDQLDRPHLLVGGCRSDNFRAGLDATYYGVRFVRHLCLYDQTNDPTSGIAFTPSYLPFEGTTPSIHRP